MDQSSAQRLPSDGNSTSTISRFPRSTLAISSHASRPLLISTRTLSSGSNLWTARRPFSIFYPRHTMPSPALLRLDTGPNSNPPSRRGSLANLAGLELTSKSQSSYVKEALKRAALQLETLESSKRLAAYTAVDKHVLPEHRVSLLY